MPGMGELVVILLIVLVVFGANKLPGIGDALGRSIKNFKRASKVEDNDQADEKVGEKPAAKKQLPAKKAAKQLEASAEDDDGEWEEVVVRRKKKPASGEG